MYIDAPFGIDVVVALRNYNDELLRFSETWLFAAYFVGGRKSPRVRRKEL